ncbi:MAG: hypothetical protein FWC78_09420 [Defluviitaleaceae bacterium]|nr:hypothetical protein [Defluviitaleaceae bacterium]
MNKKVELSCKALGAAVFMGMICIYMGLGVIFWLLGWGVVSQISFWFLLQGIALAMVASGAWVLSFGAGKNWGFGARYLLAIGVLAAAVGLSVAIPGLRAMDGFYLWLASGTGAALAFGNAVAVLSHRHFKATGLRSSLLWEI